MKISLEKKKIADTHSSPLSPLFTKKSSREASMNVFVHGNSLFLSFLQFLVYFVTFFVFSQFSISIMCDGFNLLYEFCGLPFTMHILV